MQQANFSACSLQGLYCVFILPELRRYMCMCLWIFAWRRCSMAAAWQRLLGYRTCTACRWNVRWSKRCVHRAPTVQRRPSLHDRSPRMRLANCIAAEAGCQNSLNALRKIYNADDKEPGKEFISKEYLESIYRSCHEAQLEVKTEEREKHSGVKGS